jgi:hypothetical protein
MAASIYNCHQSAHVHKLQWHPSIWCSSHNLKCESYRLFPWLIHCLLTANDASVLVNGGHEFATYHTTLKVILQWNLAPFCVRESMIRDNIQGYYKRNRHFQCCTETKLLTIWPNYSHGFVVHVFKFIWRSYICSVRAFCHTTDINTSLILSKQTWAYPVNTCNSCCDVTGADVVPTSWKNARKQIFVFPLRYYANCVSTTLTVLIMLKVSISFIVTLYFAHHNINSHTFPSFHTLSSIFRINKYIPHSISYRYITVTLLYIQTCVKSVKICPLQQTYNEFCLSHKTEFLKIKH